MASIGRNDPCGCGSGIKFKKCCGRANQATHDSVVSGKGPTERQTPQLIAVVSLLKDFARVARDTTYTFVPSDDYRAIVESGDIQSTNQIYWREILYRAHFGASTALLRLARWIDGVEYGEASRNPLVLASSLRGLVEAAADNYHTFASVPQTIADSHVYVRLALAGTLERMLLSPELEEGLIHFIYGRQLHPEEKAQAPASHQALHSSEYLDALAEEVPNIKSVYRDLCQMTHTASDSLFCFATRHNRVAVSFHPQVPADVMERLSIYLKQIMPKLLAYGVLPCFATLKLLNVFENSQTLTPWADTIPGEVMPPWAEIERRLRSSAPPSAVPREEIEEIFREYRRDRPDILGRARRKKRTERSS